MNKWTEEEIELLTLFIKMRYTHKEIAQELGRTEDAISKRCSRFRKIYFNNPSGESSYWAKACADFGQEELGN